MQSKRYCPNCGTKNEDFSDNGNSINVLKDEIKKSKYFESKAEKEIRVIRTKVPRIDFSEINSSDTAAGGFGSSNGSDSSADGFGSSKETGFAGGATANERSRPFIICPLCHTENELGDKYCQFCGFSLKDYKICPSCGYITKEGDNFCGDCGTKLKPIKSCPKCKSPVEINAKFCGTCGKQF